MEGGNRGNVAFGKEEGAWEVDISTDADFFAPCSEKLVRKVSLDTVPYSALCTISEHHKRFIWLTPCVMSLNVQILVRISLVKVVIHVIA